MLSQFLMESVRLEVYRVFNLQVETISNILRSETKIKDCVEINAAISASNGINPSTGKHFTEYIDQFSWLRHHWLNTLAMNVDGFRLSGYYYKHRLRHERRTRCY